MKNRRPDLIEKFGGPIQKKRKSRLTDSIVEEICKHLLNKEKYVDIAEMFDTDYVKIYRIANKEIFTEITDKYFTEKLNYGGKISNG